MPTTTVILPDGRTVIRTYGEDGTLELTRIEDTADTYHWAVREYGPETIDAQRNRIEEYTQVSDDGLVREVTFRNGEVYLDRRTDASDRFAWDYVVDRYFEDRFGAMVHREVIHWGGGTYERIERHDGIVVDYSFEDTGDQFDFASMQQRYAEDGTIVERVLLMDDGVLVSWNYRVERTNYPEATVSVSRADHDDAYAWENQYVLFDADGVLSRRYLNMDDGVSVQWDYGLRPVSEFSSYRGDIYRRRSDSDDAHDWDSEEMYFAADGTVLERFLYMDDGVDIQWDYDLGPVSELYPYRGDIYRRRSDFDDAHDWDSEEMYFTADGTVLERFLYMDDGVEIRWDYDNGVLRQLDRNDYADAHDWHHQVTSYDEAGTITSRTTTFDDGRVVERSYVDGEAGDVAMLTPPSSTDDWG